MPNPEKEKPGGGKLPLASRHYDVFFKEAGVDPATAIAAGTELQEGILETFPHLESRRRTIETTIIPLLLRGDKKGLAEFVGSLGLRFSVAIDETQGERAIAVLPAEEQPELAASDQPLLLPGDEPPPALPQEQ